MLANEDDKGLFAEDALAKLLDYEAEYGELCLCISKHMHCSLVLFELTLVHIVPTLSCSLLNVNTTPQMTRFRGAKVCSKWLQERIDDHNKQSDYKCNNWTKKYKSENSILVCYACLVTLHDYTTDTNVSMTTNTDFHTEHINTNT